MDKKKSSQQSSEP